MTTIMSGLHLILPSILLLCCTGSASSIFSEESFVACHPRHVQALTQFKNEFDTRGCNQSDYSNGVWCDNSTGAVTKLELKACLNGPLKSNSSLFQFHELRYLVLFHNNFTSSSVPSEFGNLNKLEVLSLSFNGFLGQVPSSFSNLSSLSILDLSNNHLSGPLNSNSSLFGLHHLTYLNLAYNGFIGKVPPTISNITLLTELYLSNNKLNGSFPPVQNLTKLSILVFSNNNFTGSIPSSLLTMPFLTYLDLRENHLTGSIEVPNSSSSSRLEGLLLGNNHFERKILEPISNLVNLTDLDLSFLNTSYPIDLSFLSSLKSLVALDISTNNISPASLRSDTDFPLNVRMLQLSDCGISEFPNILKTLQNLEFIEASHNRIKGKIPEWLWSLPRLSSVVLINNSINGYEGSTEVQANSTSMLVLNLDKNCFEGALPDLPLSISVFSASYNSFTGEVPLSICNRSSLTALDLAYNNFTGPIPQCLSNFTLFNLRKNNLQGSIPDMFYTDSCLQSLDVGYNRLTGKLPRSLLNCSSLGFLSVDNNRIKDTFPFWLKALTNLRVLTLRSNKFYGSISPLDQGPLGFPELQILEISANNFTGSLPPNFFENWKASSLTMNQEGALYMSNTMNPYGRNLYVFKNHIDLRYKGLHMEQEYVLTSYSAIDFSGNLLHGQISESIGLLKELIALDFSNNAFTGHIPLSLSNLKELESLDLSRNQLSGTIPSGLGSLSFLAYINVSHNQLKGEIPQGPQITGQSKSSFEGNSGLCGLPLDESCFGTNLPPTQQPKQEDGEEEGAVLYWKAVAIGYGSGVFLGLAIAQIIASYKPEWLAKITGPNTRRNCWDFLSLGLIFEYLSGCYLFLFCV